MLKKIPRTTQNILAAGLLAGLAAAGILAALRVWPFGDGSLLTGDLNGMYLNFFADLKDRFWSDGFFYSLRKMAGGSTLGLFAYYMASPFDLLYLILPKAAYSEVVCLCFALRAMLAAGVFCFFLQRHLGATSRVFIAAGAAWALCAFFVIYNQNVIWMDAVITLPLVMWGVDRLVRRGRVLPFTLLLAATMVLNFYTAFSICIFSALYFIYAWVAARPAGGGGLPAAGPGGEAGAIPFTASTAEQGGPGTPGQGRQPPAGGAGSLPMACTAMPRQPTFPLTALRFAACGLLAAGLAMVLLLPALVEVLAAGDLGTAQLSLTPNFPLLRLPEQFFPGTFFWGDVIDGMPLLYCGLPAMMLAGAYFAARRVPLREKLAAGGILLVLILSMWLQAPDVVWQGFKPPTWFPHRYSFVFSAFLLLLACRALLLVFSLRPAGAGGSQPAGATASPTAFIPPPGAPGACCPAAPSQPPPTASSAKKRHPPRLSRAAQCALGILLGGGVFIVYTAATAQGNIISAPKVALAAAAVLGTAAAVWLHGQGRPARRRAAVALLCLVMAADVTANALLSIRKFEYYPRSGYVGYVQDTTATLAALREHDPGLYRVETPNSRTQNDPMLVGAMGISHYSSLMPDGVPRLRERLGYVNYSIYGWGSTALADALLGIRYLYAAEGQRAPAAHWQPLGLEASAAAWENPYAFPLAYTAPAALLDIPLDDYVADTFALQNAIAAALAPGSEPPLVPVEHRAETGDLLLLSATMPVEGPLYFALPYTGQWTGELRVDGEKLCDYFAADTLGGVVCLGRFAAGQQVQVALHSPATEADAAAARLYALDEGAMAALAQTVGQNAAENLAAGDGGALTCRATAAGEGQLLVLAFAWDENWQATINGRPAEVLPLLGGLMAVRLPAGESEVALRFVHPGAGPGLGITLASAAALVLWVWLARRKRRRDGGQVK